MVRFKPFLLVYLAVHALTDLGLGVAIYYQAGIVMPSIFLVVLCCVFSVSLYRALRDEEFHWRSFRHAGPISMQSEPVAFWSTFAVIALFHLYITGSLLARL